MIKVRQLNLCVLLAKSINPEKIDEYFRFLKNYLQIDKMYYETHNNEQIFVDWWAQLYDCLNMSIW